MFNLLSTFEEVKSFVDFTDVNILRIFIFVRLNKLSSGKIDDQWLSLDLRFRSPYCSTQHEL